MGQRQAARALRRVEGVRVPKTEGELCHEDVLVSELLEGPTLAAGAPDDPGRVGRTLVRAHVTALAGGLALTDPRRATSCCSAAMNIGSAGTGVARPADRARATLALHAVAALRGGDADGFAAILDGELGPPGRRRRAAGRLVRAGDARPRRGRAVSGSTPATWRASATARWRGSGRGSAWPGVRAHGPPTSARYGWPASSRCCWRASAPRRTGSRWRRSADARPGPGDTARPGAPTASVRSGVRLLRPALIAVLALAAAPASASATRVLYVGDSLGVGTTPYLRGLLPGTPVRADNRVGRPSGEAVGVLARLIRPSDTVIVFDAGTNDDTRATAAYAARLRAVRHLAGSRCVVLATLNRPPLNGVGPGRLNAVISGFSYQDPNVEVADWAAAVNRRILARDGVHATGRGYALRARLRRAGDPGLPGRGRGAAAPARAGRAGAGDARAGEAPSAPAREAAASGLGAVGVRDIAPPMSALGQKRT